MSASNCCYVWRHIDRWTDNNLNDGLIQPVVTAALLTITDRQWILTASTGHTFHTELLFWKTAARSPSQQSPKTSHHIRIHQIQVVLRTDQDSKQTPDITHLWLNICRTNQLTKRPTFIRTNAIYIHTQQYVIYERLILPDASTPSTPVSCWPDSRPSSRAELEALSRSSEQPMDRPAPQ